MPTIICGNSACDTKAVESPRLIQIPADGVDLAVWEWPGMAPSHAATLVFAHATGFHGRCWDQIARRFPEHRRLALDFRGHGRSSKPDPPYYWQGFADDLAALLDTLHIHGAVGIGHSMGGHSVVAAAIQRPAAFASMVLIDPTIWPPERYVGSHEEAAFVLRRRTVFASPEEMWERFKDRAPFAAWQPQVLRDYCQFALLPVDDHYELACSPLVEASIYSQSTAFESNIYAGIPSLTQPVLVMRASTPSQPGVFDFNTSPTAPDLAARFPNGRDLPLPGRGHYIPLETPDLVAEWIARYLPPAP
jgi:lipase